MSKGANIRGFVLEVYRDPEDGSWVADVPELPGCVAASADPADLFAHAEDAIEAWIEAAKEDGRPVPVPRGVEDEYSGRFVLRVPKSLHRRLVVEAKHDGVSLNTYCVSSLSQAVGTSSHRMWESAPTAKYVGEAAFNTVLYGVVAAASPVVVTAGGRRFEMYKAVGSPSLLTEPSPNIPYLAAKYAGQRG